MFTSHFMKISLFSLIFAFSFSMPNLTKASSTIPEGQYKIDPAHSKIGFEISHLVISTVEGHFNNYSGIINIDASDVEKSIFESEIQTASIDTGIKQRDEHLKSPDFFDTKKFPKITFKSKKVSWSDPEIKITGDFTMHGVTKEITLEGKYSGSVKDMYGMNRIAFSATTKIKRQDFGLAWNKMIESGPVVGDEVGIKIVVEAIKEEAKPAKEKKKK